MYKLKRIIRSIVYSHFRPEFFWFLQKGERRKNPLISDSAVVENSYTKGLRAIGERSLLEHSIVSGNVRIGDHSRISNLEMSGDIEVGRYSTISGPNTRIVASTNKVVIGNFCSIASGCHFYEANHITKRCTSYNIFRNLIDAKSRQDCVWEGDVSRDTTSRGSILIGHDVWIGAQSIVLSGVKVGTGAVIGANTTVTRDLPPYSIAVGNPARIVSYRFSHVIIEALLKTEWWLWDDEKIRRNANFFDGEISLDKILSIVN